LRFPVGHHYEYSNLGIDLTAYVLQRVSRLPFHEFVRRRLFAPLGLERTSFDQRAIAARPDRAVGHWRPAKRLPAKVPMIGAGGLYTSVGDACRFVRFFLDDGAGLLSSDLVQEMYRIPFAALEQEQGYGLGIAIQRWNGVEALGHSGGGFGFLADISWSRAVDIGIVVLTNSVDHPLQGELVKRILFDLVDAKPQSSDALAPALGASPEVLDRFAGEYIGRFNNRRIVVESGRLWLIRNDERQPLRVIGPDEVMIEDNSRDRYRLLAGHDGRPVYLQRANDGLVWYRNAGAGRAPSVSFDEHDGNYVLLANGVKVGTARIHSDDAGRKLLDIQNASLELQQHRPGLWFSCTGEALDLRRTRPTYANIPLYRRER
jgi:hypothetical protein